MYIYIFIYLYYTYPILTIEIANFEGYICITGLSSLLRKVVEPTN